MDLPILKRMKEGVKASVRSASFWAGVAGAALPLLTLVFLSIKNSSPVTGSETTMLLIGSERDTETSAIYIKPSKDLGERRVNADGAPYRELNGMARISLTPDTKVIKAKATFTSDKGIFIIPPQIAFEPNNVSWTQFWNFQDSVPTTFVSTTVFHFDDSAYFDGKSRLELPESSEDFETGPFSVYAEWKPENSSANFQQIIGHFNWEIIQNSNSVLYQVGRMDNATGTIQYIEYPITSDFFGKKHQLLAIYQPSSENNGYIELFIDNMFAGRKYIGRSKIWTDYGRNNLSMGWTPHNYGKNPYFEGSIYRAGYTRLNVAEGISEGILKENSKNEFLFYATSQTTSTWSRLEIKISTE